MFKDGRYWNATRDEGHPGFAFVVLKQQIFCWSFLILCCRKETRMRPPTELAACTCLSLAGMDRSAPLWLSCSAWTLQQFWIWNGEWRAASAAVARFLCVHCSAPSGATCPCPDGPCWGWRPPRASCSCTLCGRVRWEGVGSDGACVRLCVHVCFQQEGQRSLQTLSSTEVGAERLVLSLDWSTGRMDRYWTLQELLGPNVLTEPSCANLCLQQWCARGVQRLSRLCGCVLLCWRRSNPSVPVEGPWLWGLDHSLLLLGHTAAFFW